MFDAPAPPAVSRAHLIDATLRRFSWRLDKVRALRASTHPGLTVDDAAIWRAFSEPGSPTADDLLALIQGEFGRVCRERARR